MTDRERYLDCVLGKPVDRPPYWLYWSPWGPTWALMGGIDKRALAVGPEAIDAELDRIWPAVETGRHIPDLDHLVPDDVSWDNYRYYCEQLRLRVVGTLP